MARSSRRRGAKMPGVSTRMICERSSMTMPRISARVVCTLLETMVTFEPTSALTSVDLPTFGAPISATKPQRVEAAAASGSAITAARHALAHQQRRSRRFLGGVLGAAEPFGDGHARQFDGNAELRTVMRSGPLDLAIARRRQSLALRPLLQHGLRIAQGPDRPPHAVGPRALNHL